MSARSGSTLRHNALPNKINLDRTSIYIDVLVHSVFVESLYLTLLRDSDSQIHSLQYFIAEKYYVLKPWWGVYAILLLCWGIQCLITLLSYIQH